CPGSGDGQFSFPEGVAVDGSGNVFVADSYNRIQKFVCAIEECTGCSSCGDVNGDGSVSIGDALVVAQYVVGLRTCAQLAHADRCDVNNNGTCDIRRPQDRAVRCGPYPLRLHMRVIPMSVEGSVRSLALLLVLYASAAHAASAT